MDYLITIWLAAGVAACIALCVRPAPYGRHAEAGWGPMVSGRTGWIVMESPALFTVLALFATAPRAAGAAGAAEIVFLLLWCLHYGNRAGLYALRMPPDSARMPVLIAFFGAVFHVVNGWLQGIWLFHRGTERGIGWLRDPRFVVGLVIFLGGMMLNWWADGVLLKLRRSGRYQIPRGGLFERVSCPNYLGEMIEWTGWAVLTWSAAGAAFAVWTAANLAPRAVSHHRWYRQQFPDYPTERRALIPF